MVERRLWHVGLFGALWFLLCAVMSNLRWLAVFVSPDIIILTIGVLRFGLAFTLSMAMAYSIVALIVDAGRRTLQGGKAWQPTPTWLRVLAAVLTLAFAAPLGWGFFLAAQILGLVLAFHPNPTLTVAYAASAFLWYLIFWTIRRWRGRSAA